MGPEQLQERVERCAAKLASDDFEAAMELWNDAVVHGDVHAAVCNPAFAGDASCVSMQPLCAIPHAFDVDEALAAKRVALRWRTNIAGSSHARSRLAVAADP